MRGVTVGKEFHRLDFAAVLALARGALRVALGLRGAFFAACDVVLLAGACAAALCAKSFMVLLAMCWNCSVNAPHQCEGSIGAAAG
jgi:hypothetical protein